MTEPRDTRPGGCLGKCSGNEYFEMISGVYPLYRPADEGRSAAEVAVLEAERARRTGAEGPGLALDLMCGRGRHSIVLADRGWRVVAFDLDTKFLSHVRHEASRRELDVEVAAGDMRDLRIQGAFDLVLSLGTSFGIGMNGAEDCLKSLVRIHGLLSDAGMVALEVFDPHVRFSDGSKRRDHVVPGFGTLHKTAIWDPSTEVEHVVGTVDWAQAVTAACYRQFTPTISTMTALLTQAGFRSVSVSSGTIGWPAHDAYVCFAQRVGCVA